MGLYSQLTANYAVDPERIVLDCDSGQRWTLGALEAVGERMLARIASHELVAGDRVLVQVHKSAEVVALYLACVRARLVFVPLNTAYTTSEVEYFVDDADPALVIIDPSVVLHNMTRPVYTLDARGAGSLLDDRNRRTDADTGGRSDAGASKARASVADESCRTGSATGEHAQDGDRPAVIIYTSGTTGRSKGAVLSRDNLLSNARALVDAWGFSACDVLLHCLPVFHVHGLFIALHTAMLSGARVRFCSTFDPLQVCRELPDSTVFMGVPTYYTRLLACGEFTHEVCRAMRLFVSGSAPLLPETFASFERVTGQRILERYGMSETNVITSNPLNGRRVAGTVGFALDGTEVRVADDQDQSVAVHDVGAVQVSGAGVFGGYWRRPELAASEFTQDGFFRTGDLGRCDEEGRLSLIGRAKDLIISGGLNVYPAEVERFLDELPGVVESAVVGVPDADFGERVEAFVVASGDDSALIDSLRRAVKAGLANFKRPKAFHLIESLPRNTMGKVQKTVLRQRRTRSTDES